MAKSKSSFKGSVNTAGKPRATKDTSVATQPGGKGPMKANTLVKGSGGSTGHC